MKTIIKNAFWLGLSEALTKGITFITFIWLARHFGPEIYGEWAFSLGFVGLFAILIDFGFTTLTIREVARDKSILNRYIDNILLMKAILGLIFMGLIVFISQFLGKQPEVVRLVYFLAVYTVINNFVTFFQSIFQANEKMQYVAFCQAIQNLSLLALSAFFIFNNGSIITISYAFIGGTLLGFLFSLLLVWKYFSKLFLRIDLETCKEILKRSWPFLFSGIFYMIYFGIGSIMIGIMSNMAEVGYYNAAYNLFTAIFVIPGIITMSFFPRLSHSYKNNKADFIKMFSNFKVIMILTGIPLAIILFSFSKFIIVKIYSQGFFSSVIVLEVFSAAIIFRFLSYVYSWFLTSANEQRQVLKVQAAAALLNIILNYFLIIKYNATGAAVSIVITDVFLLASYYWFFRIKWREVNGIIKAN